MPSKSWAKLGGSKRSRLESAGGKQCWFIALKIHQLMVWSTTVDVPSKFDIYQYWKILMGIFIHENPYHGLQKKNTLCYFILRILLNTKFFKVSAGSVSHTPALQATSVGLTRETYWNPKPETQITFCINLSPVAFSKQWNSQIFWHPGSVEPRPTQHTKKSWETLHVALGFQVSSWIFCNGSTFHSSHLYLQKQVRNHWNHPESIELVHIVPTVYEIKLKCKSDTNYTYTHTLQTCTRVFISKHRNDSDLQDLSFPLRSWTKNNKIEDKHMFFEPWDTTKTVRKNPQGCDVTSTSAKIIKYLQSIHELQLKLGFWSRKGCGFPHIIISI